MRTYVCVWSINLLKYDKRFYLNDMLFFIAIIKAFRLGCLRHSATLICFVIQKSFQFIILSCCSCNGTVYGSKQASNQGAIGLGKISPNCPDGKNFLERCFLPPVFVELLCLYPNTSMWIVNDAWNIAKRSIQLNKMAKCVMGDDYAKLHRCETRLIIIIVSTARWSYSTKINAENGVRNGGERLERDSNEIYCMQRHCCLLIQTLNII